MNSTIESGGLKELEFGGASPCISGRGVGWIKFFSFSQSEKFAGESVLFY